MCGTTINLGLIGLGRWGRNYIPAIGSISGLRLLRAADLDPSTFTCVDADCAVSTDWRDLLGAGDLDGVIVATPPHRHVEIARAAVMAGLPVLVEKPLALSSDEANGLLALAEMRGGYVLTDHVHLFQPEYRRLKELSCSLGAIHSIWSNGGRWGPFRSDTSVLWDWGPHDIAFVLDLIGERPVRIDAALVEGRALPEGYGETLTVDMTFSRGRRAVIEVGNLYWEKRRRLEVACATGTLVFDDTVEDRLVRRDGTGTVRLEAIPGAGTPPLTGALLEFTNSIATRPRDLSPLRLAVDVVVVLEACDKILRGGNVERMP